MVLQDQDWPRELCVDSGSGLWLERPACEQTQVHSCELAEVLMLLQVLGKECSQDLDQERQPRPHSTHTPGRQSKQGSWYIPPGKKTGLPGGALFFLF